ncbi:PadR family transcriptional regulator [Micromonospora okii]|uniref:PadR family transcriptional regulator n=1 Tax=Micromonospora okii TaxID=1182970 RepID=UPI001E3101B2|nr:helix-turn-helix transcriptional regulator [Micromonospora okii]
MPLDASRNSLVLPLLGLLVEEPAHAYDLAARLDERYGHLSVSRSTVRSLLKAIERAGLVAARRPEQVGNRPPRTTYELTAAGMAQFRRRVEAGLRDAPVASVDFTMAVAYLGILPAEQAATRLDGRADRLDRELTALRARPADVREAHMLEAAYWGTVVAAEAAWLRALAGRIRAHDIEWPGGQPAEPEEIQA